MTVIISGDTGIDTVGPNTVGNAQLIDLSVQLTKLGFTLPFTKEYVSAEQTITSGGLLTLPHGLGAVPKLVTGELVCKVDQAGFVAGNVIGAQIWWFPNSGFDDKGITFVRTPTSLIGRYGSNATPFAANNFNTGAGVDLVNANWRLVIRAWA